MIIMSCLQYTMKEVDKKMIEHLVFFKMQPQATAADRQTFVDTLYSLRSVAGIVEMSVGSNVSKEGKSKGYEYAMRMLFQDQSSLDAYLPSAEHVAAVKQIRPFFSDVIVVDYEVSK